MPDRKVLAGGTSALFAWVLILVATKAGYTIPAEYQAILPAVVGYVISYVVPPSVRDVLKRIDGQIVEIVAKDPTIPLVRK